MYREVQCIIYVYMYVKILIICLRLECYFNTRLFGWHSIFMSFNLYVNCGVIWVTCRLFDNQFGSIQSLTDTCKEWYGIMGFFGGNPHRISLTSFGSSFTFRYFFGLPFLIGWMSPCALVNCRLTSGLWYVHSLRTSR